jgi:hypothetical protein
MKNRFVDLWPDLVVFTIVGFLISYSLVWLFSMPYSYAFPLSYGFLYYFSLSRFFNISSFFSSELANEEKKVDNTYLRLEKVHDGIGKIYQHMLDMDLYDEMTREDAINHLKKISKSIQDISEEEQKRRYSQIKKITTY